MKFFDGTTEIRFFGSNKSAVADCLLAEKVPIEFIIQLQNFTRSAKQPPIISYLIFVQVGASSPT